MNFSGYFGLVVDADAPDVLLLRLLLSPLKMSPHDRPVKLLLHPDPASVNVLLRLSRLPGAA